MHKLLIPLLIALVTSGGILVGVERGNRLFRAGKYVEAVDAYRAALADGEEGPALRYNLGTALLKLGRYAEAEEQLRAALEEVDPSTRDRAYYNLGQRYLEDARQSGDGDPEATRALYDAAVEAYRQALRLSPDDPDAKWNYELSVRERDEQQQSGGGGGEDPQDQQDQQDQEPQAGDQGQGGSSQGQNQPSPGTPDAQGEGTQAPMTQEQAERILSAVEQDERELFRDKLRKGQQRTRADRDW